MKELTEASESKTMRGRGGAVEDIKVSNVSMYNMINEGILHIEIPVNKPGTAFRKNTGGKKYPVIRY